MSTPKFGDMPVSDFRKHGHELVDMMADYFEHIEDYPVLSTVKPGDIEKQLPATPPENGEDFGEMIKDVEKIIMPGVTHWNHPGFHAYFASTASAPGILADLISSSFNANGMIWKTCPASSELESVTLDWLRQIIGLDGNFWGIIYDTASVSTMHAIAAARENITAYKLREKGLTGSGVPRLRLYASEHAHSSVEKGVIALGMGIDGTRKIKTDKDYRIIPAELESAIEEDIKNGWLPFCVVATIGTTSITSIDPVEEIAAICKKYNLWLHIDGAYGGVAAIVPEMRYVLKGCEHADSFVVNPHKWLFTPFDLSVLYTTKPDVLKRAFSLVADYLKTAEDTAVINRMDYGVQLGRRFRSLKLWFVLRYFGRKGLEERLREHMRLAKDFGEWIKENKAFELLAPVPLSTVCFRAVPVKGMSLEEINALNEKLMNEINATGKMFISHTKLNGVFTLRFVVSGLRTEEKHVESAKEIIETTLGKMIK
jgi:aromatic-L-amino-acid/L-tryptophan decarboxylase